MAPCTHGASSPVVPHCDSNGPAWVHGTLPGAPKSRNDAQLGALPRRSCTDAASRRPLLLHGLPAAPSARTRAPFVQTAIQLAPPPTEQMAFSGSVCTDSLHV